MTHFTKRDGNLTKEADLFVPTAKVVQIYCLQENKQVVKQYVQRIGYKTKQGVIIIKVYYVY